MSNESLHHGQLADQEQQRISRWRQQISLIVLVAQNSLLVLMMRYSRVKGQGSQGEEADSATYAASTAVFMAEMIKMVLCVIMIRITEPDKRIAYEVFGKPRETLRMVIPSGLYALQNNLLYIALTHLEAATFQVTYQLKILSTAIFSVLLLGRSLSTQQWIALVLLMVGVTLVQMESSGTNDETSDPGAHGKNSIMGLTAVLASCVSSGFSGCYFEKLLKTSRTSMWVRNLQLGVCGATFSFVGMLLADGVAVWQHGMFHGYSLLTWLVVINQALGGLLVATVVKYADNILKGFATSLSILLSGLITFYFFDFSPSPAFLVGATVVILATYLYGRAMKTPTHSSSAPSTAISTVKLH